MKKTIVFFTARDLSNVGGGERMLSIIANALCIDYNIVILTPYVSIPNYRFQDSVTIQTLGFIYQQSSIKRKVQYIGILKALRNFLHTVACDYFIAASSMAITLVSIVARRNDSRLYAWMHTSYFAPTPFILKWFNHRMLRKFRVISINSMDMNSYKKLTNNVCQIPNPLPFRSKIKSDRTQPRIISVGRLEHGKRFDLLIEICAKVFAKYPDWVLDIYGQDDGEKQSLLKLIRKKNMYERIKIHEPINTIHQEYLKSSIFLTTTSIEAFPLVLLEACECGLPCITYDVPSGPRDIIINGYNGFLIQDLDSKTYCDMIISLITSQELRDQMGLNAIKKASEFSTPDIIAQWKALLK